MNATEKQVEYIRILSDYRSTKNEDEKDISEFLKEKGKAQIEDLTKAEASSLIGLLLERPVEYEFPCGKKIITDKKNYNRFEVLGDIEACLHDCPEDIDIHDCHVWKKRMDNGE